MRKKAKPVVLRTEEAIRRLETIMPRLKENMESALKIEATLEVGNEIVGRMTDREFPGASAYNIIKRSLTFDLALHLARLFDARPIKRPNRDTGKMVYVGRHPNRRDEASIPLLIRLLRQKRCQKILKDRARNWNPVRDDWMSARFEADCAGAIDKAIAGYSKVFKGELGRSGLSALKEMRDTYIAHSSVKDRDRDIQYRHLFRLVDDARDIVEAASIAIVGHDLSLDRLEMDAREEAEEFWERALLGTSREGDMPAEDAAQ
ncbi:hypothetical protein ELI44_09090 [Rhizobium ruizarguesonis]|uniref:AbiU2 domain-containing protein n=1 Tax=Rhizobium ruizarguesonis TaxID=2081791 RepID=UPI0010300C81|nr:hypothetical protein [Rhizobium ruizarguesonis]TAU48160.1 hypothetical protein ELI42_09065 [Rhizobium ruizarguesonis]TAU63231.1 hypothetical protein ELI44_09090 [Rhizobium ruizarguesonis]